MSTPSVWLLVVRGDFEVTDKLRIPGGWLYRTTFLHTHSHEVLATSLVFQPERAE
jgi:hypothetical protein